MDIDECVNTHIPHTLPGPTRNNGPEEPPGLVPRYLIRVIWFEGMPLYLQGYLVDPNHKFKMQSKAL